MMQRNNPMAMMMQMMRGGGNPNAMLQQMANQNPQVRQFMQMINGKSPQQLRQIAENVAKERGTTLNDVARQLGITLPIDR